MEGMIGLVSCLLCAFPLFVIGYFGKSSREPISFWSGDKTLKEKVNNVEEYNSEIAKLYRNCALAFAVTGVVWIVYWWLGMILILLECTAGIYIVWKLYKKILSRYS